MSSVAEFWDLLQGAKRAQNYQFSRMRAQFLLCHLDVKHENLQDSIKHLFLSFAVSSSPS